MPLDGNVEAFETPAVVKPEVFSLDHVTAWLEMKAADEMYCYHGVTGPCLWHQYISEHGMAAHSIGGAYWRDDQSECHPLPGCKTVDDFDGWGAKLASAHPRTFGAALNRARALALKAEGV